MHSFKFLSSAIPTTQTTDAPTTSITDAPTTTASTTDVSGMFHDFVQLEMVLFV